MKRIKLLAALILPLLISSCKSELYHSGWQSNVVVADGNPQEWEIPLRFYDGKSKLAYTISNDLENLYICIRMTEDASQVKVMKAGMQIWIDTTGGNKQTTGILFPQRPPESSDAGSRSSGSESDGGERRKSNEGGGESGNRSGGNRSPNMAKMRSSFQKDYKEMMLTGFKAPARGSVPLHNDLGIQLGINWDANKYDSSYIMIYEAIIPFRTFYHNKLSSADSLRNIGITIQVNALSRPASPGGSHGGGGNRGGGGGMGGGGMRGGGMGGGGGGHRGGGGGARPAEPANPLYESNTVKMRMQLSLHPRPSMTL
ncbi:MAG TPA: hypothetical protein VNZ86_18745 [Bacteroidia bacterium]|jgi:hypothetical protein|nr:hypothetical protein [Bacteroidia bacterium]